MNSLKTSNISGIAILKSYSRSKKITRFNIDSPDGTRYKCFTFNKIKIIPNIAYIVNGYLYSDNSFKALSIEPCEKEYEKKIQAMCFFLTIKGIGPSTAEKLIDFLGHDALEKIISTPSILENIPTNIANRSIVNELIKSFTDKKIERAQSTAQVSLFLIKNGISPTYTTTLIDNYGLKVGEIIQKDPYLILSLVPSQFSLIDKLGEELGIAKTSPKRINGAIYYRLNNFGDGNIYHIKSDVIDWVYKSLGVVTLNKESIKSALDQMAQDKEIVFETLPNGEEIVYSKLWFNTEMAISKDLITRLSLGKNRVFNDLQNYLNKKVGNVLDPEQISAISTALENPISILTGSAGSGKTTVIKHLIDFLYYHPLVLTKNGQPTYIRPVVATFTGIASERAAQITEYTECKTLHSLLGIYEMNSNLLSYTSRFSKKSPLPFSAIIIDESSMVGMDLFNILLSSIDNDTKVILVGDSHQLPAITSGNLLHEVVKSGVIPHVDLPISHRNKNTVLENAKKICYGDKDLIFDEDFILLDLETPLEYLRLVYNPDSDFIITGIHHGENGTIKLNNSLQKIFNRKPTLKIGGGYGVSIGDKIVSMRNDYRLGVFNGTIARVIDIGIDSMTIEPLITRGSYSPKSIIVKDKDLEIFNLGYALTCHKHQGAEADTIFIVLDESHSGVYSRNWLYTAVTRARKNVVLIGNKKEIDYCIDKEDESLRRQSNLSSKIIEEFNRKKDKKEEEKEEEKVGEDIPSDKYF